MEFAWTDEIGTRYCSTCEKARRERRASEQALHVAVDDEVLLSSATAATFCTPFCPPIPPPPPLFVVVVVLLCFALFPACRCSSGTKVQLTRGCNAAQLVDTEAGRQTDSQRHLLLLMLLTMANSVVVVGREYYSTNRRQSYCHDQVANKSGTRR